MEPPVHIGTSFRALKQVGTTDYLFVGTIKSKLDEDNSYEVSFKPMTATVHRMLHEETFQCPRHIVLQFMSPTPAHVELFHGFRPYLDEPHEVNIMNEGSEDSGGFYGPEDPSRKRTRNGPDDVALEEHS